MMCCSSYQDADQALYVLAHPSLYSDADRQRARKTIHGWQNISEVEPDIHRGGPPEYT